MLARIVAWKDNSKKSAIKGQNRFRFTNLQNHRNKQGMVLSIPCLSKTFEYC